MIVGCRNFAALLVLAGVCVGCSKKNTNITVIGSVTRGGQALKVGPTGYVQVTLHPDVGPEAAFTPRIAECDKASGKFEIRDIPPGRYKIGVEQFDPDPTSDKLNGAMRAERGRFVRELDGKASLDIDLAKPDAK
jgi:hypothetical protein